MKFKIKRKQLDNGHQQFNKTKIIHNYVLFLTILKIVIVYNVYSLYTI